MNNMSEQVFEEIKNVIKVISIFQSKEKTLREELDFFKRKWPEVATQPFRNLYVGALKRLEHEVMFLCIEVYSLYEGIAKKRSLYSKVIKDNGKLLSKIDKTPKNRDSYIFLGIVDSDEGCRDFTPQEEEELIKEMEKEAYKNRKEIKEYVGITSHKHDELDKWFAEVLDQNILLELSQYRDNFAHRLDSLENLKSELKRINPEEITRMLNVVADVLEIYKNCFKNILVYTQSQYYLGRKGFKYDSLSRLKLAESLSAMD